MTHPRTPPRYSDAQQSRLERGLVPCFAGQTNPPPAPGPMRVDPACAERLATHSSCKILHES
eukprot:scaffold808_cov370-Prasinococcus_capsulatus_cf.AAC.18